MSDSLQPHGQQHARLPSPSPRVCSNSCPLNWYAIQPSHPLLPSSPPQSFPASGYFLASRLFRIMWPKFWSFSFSIRPSNEYSELISFRIDWIDLLSPGPQLESINPSVLSFLYGPTFTSIHDSEEYIEGSILLVEFLLFEALY